MFGAGAELLGNYLTTVADWDEERARIVVVNNSTVATAPGVMHGAVIVQPLETERRIINSTMIVPASLAVKNVEATVPEFIHTDAVAGELGPRS